MNIDRGVQQEYIYNGLIPLDTRGITAHTLLSAFSFYLAKDTVVPAKSISSHTDMVSGSVLYFFHGTGHNNYDEPLYPVCVTNRKIGKTVQFSLKPTANEDTCKECVYGAFQCPLKQYINAENIVLKQPEIQLAHYDLASIYKDLRSPNFNTDQYEIPQVDTYRTALSIFEIYGKEYMSPANWKKIVRYYSYYDNFSASGEVKNKLDPNEAINSIRLFVNGLPQAFILEPETRSKLVSRFYQATKYALSNEAYDSLISNSQKIVQGHDYNSEYIQMLHGIDKMRKVITSKEFKPKREKLPHVYDFFQFIVNGYNIHNIADAYNLDIGESRVDTYRSCLKKMLMGEADDLYFAYLVPGALDLVYFTQGSRWADHDEGGKENPISIDDQILNIAKSSFNMVVDHVKDLIAFREGPEIAEYIHNRVILFRSFMRILLYMNNDLGIEDMGNDELVLEKLKGYDNLPECVASILALPTSYFAGSKFGLKSLLGLQLEKDAAKLGIKKVNEPSYVTTEMISEELYYDQAHINKAVSVFCDVVLNLVEYKKDSFEMMTKNDWINIFADHSEKCKQFAHELRQAMYPDKEFKEEVIV